MALTISIPTYNRAEKLNATLARLSAEMEQTAYDIRIFVSDNASTDDTAQVIAKWTRVNSRVTSHRNAANLGLVGNYRHCIRSCQTEFLWVCGDDDALKPGAIMDVVAAIQGDPTKGLYLLNYRRVEGNTGAVTKEVVLDPHSIAGLAGAECFTACMNQEVGCGMFITACVFRTSAAVEAINSWRGIEANLALPLFVSGRAAARQGMTLVSSVCFDGIYGVGSWKSRAFQVFMLDVPSILEVLIRTEGYPAALAAPYLANNAAYFGQPRLRMLYSPRLWWRALELYRALRKIGETSGD